MPDITEFSEFTLPDPDVQIAGVQELARDLVVIPNQRVQLVPNIGIIGGEQSVLVVDTGMGPKNADKVLAFAAEYARGRKLFLTTTHFHPEHAFGAQSFSAEATYLINQAQADDLTNRGPGYIGMFRTLGESVARALEGVELATPDSVYDQSFYLDLGGRIVHLQATGRAHTRGDQVITVPDAGVLFTGDLVETGQFAIFPWFPPHDTDVSGLGWISVMKRLAAWSPGTVVPGHNEITGPQVLTEVQNYLETLRDETWKRRDSSMSEETIVEEVLALMIEKYPDWDGREWISGGVGCLCAEHEHSAGERDLAEHDQSGQ
jgi:glyoxylase-like metal-dependent hydrolase (beta-lactamase superfamily II)